jgi:hypothetical protein
MILSWFYLKLCYLFRNWSKFIWMCFDFNLKIMHTTTLLHTAALPDSRTLPHCLTLPHTATRTVGQPHSATSTATHCRVHCRTLAHALSHTSARIGAHHCITAHCRTAWQPHTDARIAGLQLHTATSTATLCHAHCCTLPSALPHTVTHIRTLPHCRTAAHCRALPDSPTLPQAPPVTATHTAALYRTAALTLHKLKCRTSHTAHCTLHSCTP